MPIKLKVKIKDQWYTVEVGDLTSNPLEVLVDGDIVEVQFDHSLSDASESSHSDNVTTVTPVPAQPMSSAPASTGPAPTASKVFVSPMPGIIVSVAFNVGDQVITGDDVCVIEAMKMQQVLRADWSGVVKVVHVQPGQQVLDGDVLLELE